MKVRDGYDLYIGGNAKGANTKTGTLFKEQLNPEELYEIVEKIINL